MKHIEWLDAEQELQIITGDQIIRIRSWANKLDVYTQQINSANRQWLKKPLYEYYGMSLSPTLNTDLAVVKWMQTVPLDVAKLCHQHPYNRFYCAQVLCRYPQAIALAKSNYCLFAVWCNYCCKHNLSEELLGQGVEQGPSAILSTIGVAGVASAYHFMGSISPPLLSVVQPDIVESIVGKAEHLICFAAIENIGLWHFQLLVQAPWLVNSKFFNFLITQCNAQMPLSQVLRLSADHQAQSNELALLKAASSSLIARIRSSKDYEQYKKSISRALAFK